MLYAAAFAAFALLCTIFAFKRHPIWGVYFYLATFYVFPPVRWWGSLYLHPEIRWSLLSAAITALAVFMHRGKLRDKPLWLANAPALMTLLYTAWMVVQLMWALDVPMHVSGIVWFVKYLIAFWFIYRLADTKERVRDVLFAHMLGCALLGVYAWTAGREGDRLDGVGGPGIDDSNTLGMYLATGAVVGVALLLADKGWRRWVSLPCLAFILNGIVLTNSRGAMLGLVAGLLLFGVFLVKKHRWVFAGLSLIGLMALPLLVDETFVERMWTIRDATSQQEEADASARSRVELALAQLRMFTAHPLGAGHRSTATLSPDYLDRRWLTLDKSRNEASAARSSHNTFLSTLVEQGLPGALLYICITLWSLAALLQVRRLDHIHQDHQLTTWGGAIGGALAAIFVSGNTADYLLAEVQFWMFACLVTTVQLARAGSEAGVASERSVATPPVAHLKRA